MTTPTAFEQEMLELINRARADPSGEFDAIIINQSTGTAVTSGATNAISFFGVDLALFKTQLAAFNPVAPLAWNDNLSNTATAHSSAMIAQDTQAHVLPGELGIGARFTAAGYVASVGGENIYAYSESALHSHAGFMIDWGNGPGGMQTPAGHRAGILNGAFTEVGIGAIAETNSVTSVGPIVVTQDFGTRANYQYQLVGVVFNDGDSDKFYDAGEGLGAVTITVSGSNGTFTTQTWGSGGYQLPVPTGIYTVTFSGGGLANSQSKTFSIGSQNIKVDAIFGDTSNSDILGTDSANTLIGTQNSDVINAMGGDDSISGNSGSDIIDGGSGVDTAKYTGRWSNYSVTKTGTTYTITDNRSGSPDGTDTVINVEKFQFSDGTVELAYLIDQAPSDIMLSQSFVENKAAGGSVVATLSATDNSLDTQTYTLKSGATDLFEIVGNKLQVKAGANIDFNTSNSHGITIEVSDLAGSTYSKTFTISVNDNGKVVTGTNGDDTLSGTSGNDTIDGKAGNDTLDGRAGDDTLDGRDGDDQLIGSSGNDTINGGNGIDTAVFSGAGTYYTTQLSISGATITDRRAEGDGTDHLTSIEYLDFAGTAYDGPTNIYTGVLNNSAEQLTTFIEMYIAYFNRAPDALGLYYWGTRLSAGMSLQDIAKSFFTQPETVALYPESINTGDFVNAVYNNFLGRSADTDGFDYWVGQLDSGSVQKGVFLLAIINGAKAVSGSAEDVAYIKGKADIGAYFSVIKGMSDVDNAKVAMALYDGTASGTSAAKNAVDGFYNSAIDPNNGEFLTQLIGVLDDPFTIA